MSINVAVQLSRLPSHATRNTDTAPPNPPSAQNAVPARAQRASQAPHPQPAAPLSQLATSATCRAPAVPSALQIGFEAQAFDLAQVKARLATGRAFSPEVDAKLREILGAPLCAGGLEAMFNAAWPSAVWVASYEEIVDAFDMARFTLSALDRSGKVIFDVMIGFTRAREEDDAAENPVIDMHAAGADVDPAHRGFGITAYAELMRETILRAYSSHPRSRLSLEASTASRANTGTTQAASGFYLHAARGYLFSDSQDARALPYLRKTPGGADEAQSDAALSQLALLTKYFKRWAVQQDPALNDAACAALTAACTQPYDFTQVKIAGHPLGSAYLASGAAPAWYGIHFVNPPQEVAVATQAARDRHRCNVIWDKRLQHEIATARVRADALRQQLWQGMHAADAMTRAEAYKGVAMQAHPEALPLLQSRLDMETQAQAREALSQSISLLRGEQVDAGLQRAADNAQLPDYVREEMRARLIARTSGAYAAARDT